MFRPDYTGATKLLRKALVSRNITIATNDDLYKAVLDYFEDNDFYLAARILGKITVSQDWHYVEVGLNSPFIDSMDFVNMSDSLASAIGSVISVIDSDHQYPDAITVNGNAIEFHSNGELMFRVGKVEFTEVDQGMSARCAKLFKGIKRYGDDARISKRLQSIPMLESIDCDSYRKNDVPRGQAMLAMVENYPVFLRAMLSERFNIEIKQSQALEIVAEMFGAKSWHVMKSAAEAMQSAKSPIMVYVVNGEENLFSYYRSNSEAIIGFTEQLRNHPEKTQLKVVFHGGGISFNAAYISAHNPVNDTVEGLVTFNEDIMSMITPTEIGIDEPELTSLSWVNESDFNFIVARLKKVMLVDSPLMSKLFTSSERSNNKILPIRNYLFTLIERGELRNILKVEKFSQDGKTIDKSIRPVYASTYKAELIFTQTGIELTGDYGRDKLAKLDGFNEDELLMLSKFSNIRFHSREPMPEVTIH